MTFIIRPKKPRCGHQQGERVTMNTGRMTTLRAGLLRGTELALVASALAFASLASAQVAPTTTGPADQPLGAAAAENAAAENAAAENDAAEIVVTGSRIRRDSFDASTPVSVVSAEEVTLTGTINVEDLLGDQPQFVASANGGRTGNAVPAGTAQVNLRGFGSARNLVLVNGRRFAIFGPEQITDLNTIPAALIARTEVVTGGSSAVYGSDAITGVTNFIIRQDFDGIEARSQFSIDRPTGTPNYSADLTFGKDAAISRSPPTTSSVTASPAASAAASRACRSARAASSRAREAATARAHPWSAPMSETASHVAASSASSFRVAATFPPGASATSQSRVRAAGPPAPTLR
jgi:hypothetical protein